MSRLNRRATRILTLTDGGRLAVASGQKSSSSKSSCSTSCCTQCHFDIEPLLRVIATPCSLLAPSPQQCGQKRSQKRHSPPDRTGAARHTWVSMPASRRGRETGDSKFMPHLKVMPRELGSDVEIRVRDNGLSRGTSKRKRERAAKTDRDARRRGCAAIGLRSSKSRS